MSDFRFACPNCGQRISGNTTYQGTEITCPACQKTLTVPAPPKRAATAQPSAPDAATGQPGSGNLSTLALVSFVCSLALGIGSIPGIVCGHLARARIRRNPSLAGKGLATAGLIVSYSFLVLSLAFLLVGFTVLAPPHGRQLTAKEQAANTPAVLEKRRVDEVKVGVRASELEHHLNSRFSRSGDYLDKPLRDAGNGGFFSYVMKVDPAEPMFLHCTYWGNDTASRRFDILVNDKVIATQKLDYNDPGRFFDVEYAIPQNLTHGQTNVVVVFQAYPYNAAGGIFGCQMLKR
jgi:F0F1-type ATP synthase membrane subunit c/vacuolar-type H+-ATPase subunit K